MSASEMSSLVVAGIAVVIAAGSLLISRRAHKISEMQALPRIILGHSWSSRGERGLYVKLELMPDGQDWVIVRVDVRRTWRTWRKRCFLARGDVVGQDFAEDGIAYPNFIRIGDWERSVTYELTRREIAVFLHPDAPDCDVKLEITLSTLPSPVIKRYIKSPKESPARRARRGVIKL